MIKLFKRKRTIVVLLFIAVATAVMVSVNAAAVPNPPVTGEIQVPSAVKQILERACYDCHSNETKLRWYDKLPFVSTMVAQHVVEGRANVNFSAWNKLSPADQRTTLWTMYNMMNAGNMPLPAYTAIHRGAKITETDLSVLRDYLNAMRAPVAYDSAKAITAGSHYDTLPVSPNGIRFIPDYRNWQVMSTTSRFDNGTMRVMYANPIAYTALKAGNIHPWPDGSMIVKVVWEKLQDKEGNIHPGKFLNIQYMIRDAEKYKATEGWGYARFDTPELKPYGTITSPLKCASCHQIAKQNGFVFDLSTKNQHP